MQATDGIRAAVEGMDRQVTRLAEGAAQGEGKDPVALRASWAALVEALALGPPPEYRTCPHCGSEGMRAATRCGHCWRALVPPPPTTAGHWGAPT